MSLIPSKIIPYHDGAEAFIYSNFLKSMRRHTIRTIVDPDIHYRFFHDAMETLLKNPDNQCLLCVIENDEDEFVGWILGGPEQLHFVYVKQYARRQGKATDLFKSLGYANRPLVSFNSPAGEQWLSAVVANGTDASRASVPH